MSTFKNVEEFDFCALETEFKKVMDMFFGHIERLETNPNNKKSAKNAKVLLLAASSLIHTYKALKGDEDKTTEMNLIYFLALRDFQIALKSN